MRDNVPDVPAGIWVGRIEASHDDPAVAYVVFDGHRSDLFTPWVFRTDDFGRTWTSLAGGLPDGEVAYVIREDLRNPNLLFLGTEFGLYVSLDRGAGWTRFRNGFPTVAVHDMKIHPRDDDLVIGTHGRGLWIVDDITPLQQLDPSVTARRAFLFEQRAATLWENTSRGGQRGHFWFGGANPPTIELTSSLPRAEFRSTAFVTYYIGAGTRGDVSLEIRDLVAGRTRAVSLPAEPGIHRWRWDLGFDAEPYTAEQVARVEAAFERVIAEAGAYGAQLGRMRDRFRAARTGEDQRRAVRPLLDPETGSGLGPEFATPVAGPGTYVVTLVAGGETSVASLTIRPDPLLDAPR
jgi:hypothetical protein